MVRLFACTLFKLGSFVVSQRNSRTHLRHAATRLRDAVHSGTQVQAGVTCAEWMAMMRPTCILVARVGKVETHLRGLTGPGVVSIGQSTRARIRRRDFTGRRNDRHVVLEAMRRPPRQTV